MQETQEKWVRSWVRKIPWSRNWQPTPVFLPGNFHGPRSLAGYSSWDCRELETTEPLGTHVYSSIIYNSHDMETTVHQQVNGQRRCMYVKKMNICMYNATWNKSDRKTNTVWCHLYMESKDYNKLVTITKKKQMLRYREQTSGYQWEEESGRGNIVAGD